MKRKVFIGMLIASVISMSTTVFAAPTAAFGDSSKGNHPLAPYAKSDIIVPRPKTSQYSELQRYPLNETKLQGHWAEKYIVYLTQRGCMDAEAIQPNAPITYADFANVVARLGLEPV